MSMTSSTQQLKDCFDSLSPEIEKELAELFDSNPDQGVNRMVELATGQGIQATIDDVNEFLSQLPDFETTVSLDQFKELRQSLTPEIEQQITGLIMTDYDAGVERIVEVASSKGVTIPVDEVEYLLDKLQDEEVEDNEDEDVELDAVALTAVAGGRRKARRARRSYRRARRTYRRGARAYKSYANKGVSYANKGVKAVNKGINKAMGFFGF